MDQDNGPTRRAVLGTTAVVAAAGLGELTAQAQPLSRTFVLVHGAWHGGWCWRRVADMLTVRGRKVFAPTMTGLGERSHLLTPDIRLETHIADIVNVIKWEGLKDICLVGHSYGGFVVSGVAEQLHSAISSIVYLDAFVPENGQSLYDLVPPTQKTLDDLVARKEIGMKPFPASFFKVNERDAPWVDAMCTPQPIHTFTDKIKLTGTRDRIARKAYIRATGSGSPTFDAAYNKVKADKSWRTYEMPTAGHDAMVDDPARLTEILLEVS
jgi:pimeloyl-ACP methyl ester carboxylesterase